ERARLLLSAVRVRRWATGFVDANSGLQNKRGNGPRLRRDHRSGAERRCWTRLVPLARQKTQIHSGEQRRASAPNDTVATDSETDQHLRSDHRRGAGAATLDGRAGVVCAGRVMDDAGTTTRVHTRELPAAVLGT